MRSHVRCSHCNTRHVFKLWPLETMKQFKDRMRGPMRGKGETKKEFRMRVKEWDGGAVCRHCKGKRFRIDGWMNRRNTRKMGCTCDGYVHLTGRTEWQIHRKGSPWCWFRKDGSQRVEGDPDFKDARLQESIN